MILRPLLLASLFLIFVPLLNACVAHRGNNTQVSTLVGLGGVFADSEIVLYETDHFEDGAFCIYERRVTPEQLAAVVKDGELDQADLLTLRRPLKHADGSWDSRLVYPMTIRDLRGLLPQSLSAIVEKETSSATHRLQQVQTCLAQLDGNIAELEGRIANAPRPSVWAGSRSPTTEQLAKAKEKSEFLKSKRSEVEKNVNTGDRVQHALHRIARFVHLPVPVWQHPEQELLNRIDSSIARVERERTDMNAQKELWNAWERYNKMVRESSFELESQRKMRHQKNEEMRKVSLQLEEIAALSEQGAPQDAEGGSAVRSDGGDWERGLTEPGNHRTDINTLFGRAISYAYKLFNDHCRADSRPSEPLAVDVQCPKTSRCPKPADRDKNLTAGNEGAS